MTAPAPSPQALPAAPPLRTWRPMAAWTASILLALGLAWFVGAVVVPVWQVRAVMRDFPEGQRSAPQPWQSYIERLGGPERAAARLGTYLRVPQVMTANRYGAAKLLSICGKPAVPFLVRALDDSSDERIPRVAAYGLGKIGPEAKTAVAALEASLTSQDAYLRIEAASALWRIDSASTVALRAFCGALGDERAHVRMYALGEAAVYGPSVIPDIERALKDDNPAVRAAAAEALKKIRSEEALPAHLVHWPGLFVRRGNSIVDAPQDDVAVAKHYPLFADKGSVVRGCRYTILTAKTVYGLNEPVRVIHVCEAPEPGQKVMAMGPRAVYGEYVDGKEVTPKPPAAELYAGMVLESPAVSYNYEITEYRFGTPGRHTIQWRPDVWVSNLIEIQVTEAGER